MTIRERVFSFIIIPVALTSLSACASLEKNPVVSQLDMESMLSEAGFKRTDADSREKLAAIQALPQGVIFPQIEGGENYYSYADAQNCRCVYVGDENDFRRFEQIVARRRAERNQCIDDRLRATQEEQWRVLGGLRELCGQ